MSDVHIHRTHALGLARAREISARWVEEGQRRYDLACSVETGEAGDTVEFKRSGVTGRLVVADGHFELTARLGFLLSGFQKAIQAEIEKNLDTLLARESASRED